MAESQRPLEPAPGITVAPMIRTGAGVPLQVEVSVVNSSAAARQLTVMALGVDSAWLPAPVTTPLLAPGASYVVQLTLTPATGTLPAQYPLAISVQALDASGTASGAPVGIADTVLVVNPRAQLTLELDPPALTAWRTRRFALVLRNSGGAAATVRLKPQTTGSVRLTLHQEQVEVAAGAVVRVRGRATARHPQLIGMRMRHVLRIGASGTEAARYAEGELTQRPLVPPFWLKVVAIVGILAVWIAAGITFLPKLTDHFGSGSDVVSVQAEGSGPSDADSTSGSGGSGGSGAGGSGSGGSDSGSGSAGGSGDKATGGGTASSGSGIQLNGTIKAEDPAGVRVSMRPTSLVDEDAELADVKTVGVPARLMASVGKVSSETIMLRKTAKSAKTPQQRATVTSTDGVWSFPSVSAPGYYLLVFSKPGYQTRSYVVDSSSAAAQEPLDVDLQPGEGKLSGVVTGPDGKPVGGASITISNGTSSVTASSNTKGKVGAWSVSGLSTPASYVVSASADDTSTEARDVTLAAGGSGTANLRLRTGVATLSGEVSTISVDGVVKGVGGATVTVSDGAELARTATTVTQDQLAGTYHVPALPAPGDYTVTMSGPGLQTQTSELHLRKGQGAATLDANLPSASGIVQGAVTDAAHVGLTGAGLVLSNADHTYKTTSTSGTTTDQAGSFQITGVTPGTYTLTTQLFAYTGSTLTVDVTAGGVASISPSLSKQPGGVLPATAVILGSAVDAITGKAVSTCPTKAPASPVSTATTTTTSGSDTSTVTTSTDTRQCLTATVIEESADEAGGRSTYTVPFGADEQYRLPGKADDGSTLGLRPGLYSVRVSAPGYEYADVTVQVPLGATVTAPVAQLLRAPTLQGTIGTNADSSPSSPTCVYAVPDGSTPPKTCPNPVDGKICPETPVDYNGSASTDTVCASVPAGTGGYSLQLPKHGIYTVYAVPSDDEFLTTTPITYSLDAGVTQVYDPHLDRLGRLSAAVKKPGPDGNLVAAAKDTVVTITPLKADGVTHDDAHAWTTTVDVKGQIKLTHVTAGSYVLSATDKVDTQYSGESSTITVSLNHETGATLSLTNPIGSLVGKVTTTFDGVVEPVPDAKVSITAPVSYLDNSNTAVRGVAAPVTDSGGCFGVQSGTVAPTSSCGALSGTALVQREFVSTSADVEISAPGYQTKTLAGQTLHTGATSNDFTLAPLPVVFGAALTVQPAAPADLWGKITFTATPKAGTGSSSGISVSATGSGTAGALAWTDTALSQGGAARPGFVQPGTYTITASAAGYESDSGTLRCDIGKDTSTQVSTTTTCKWIADDTGDVGIHLQQKASLTIGALTADGTAIAGARYTLHDSATGLDTVKPTTTETTVTFPDLTPDPTGKRYTVGIKAAGYHFGTVGIGGDLALTCSPTAAPGLTLVPGAKPSCTTKLTAGPKITGTAKGLTSPSADDPYQWLTGATVKVVQCTGTTADAAGCEHTTGPVFTATVKDNGSFSVAGDDTTELTTGIYQVSVSVDGWTDEGNGVKYVDVAGDGGAAAALVLRQKSVTIKVTLQDQLGHNVPGATLVLYDGHGTKFELPSSSTSTDGVYTFTTMMPGVYTYDVSGESFKTVNGGVLPPVVEDTDGAHGTQAFTVPVTLNASSLGGKVLDDKGNPVKQAQIVLCPATTTVPPVICTAPLGTDKKPMSTQTDDNGLYSLQNVPNGSYVVWASTYGYTTQYSAAYAVDYRNAPWSIQLTLSAAAQKISLTLKPTVASDPLTGAKVKLVGTGRNAGKELDLTGTVTGGSSATASYSDVASGCWTVTWTLPADHYGALSTLPASSESSDGKVVLSCPAGTLLVSGKNADVPASGETTVTEHKVDVKVLLGSSKWGSDLPGTATVKLSGTTTGDLDVNVGNAGTTSVWLDATTWSLTASADGTGSDWWKTASTSVTASDGTATLTLVQKTKTINLTVVNGKGASVTAKDSSNATYPSVKNLKLDDDGTATFALPPGTWTLTVTRGGYEDAVSDPLPLTDPDTPKTVDLELVPETPPPPSTSASPSASASASASASTEPSTSTVPAPSTSTAP